MAVQAKLFVDGEYYNLKYFEYGFKNGANSNGFSSNKTRQTGLTCEIEAIRQEHFEEWAMENYMKKYVEVHIAQGVGGMGRTRILKCHDTFLLELHTRFSSTSNEPMSFELFMKSGAIEASWSTAAHVEEWSSLPEEGEATVINNEPNILGYHIEDINGKTIDKTEIDIDEEIYLIVESENAVGEFFEIDLDSNRLDFEHNGLPLNDDILEFKITSDTEQIHLKAIAQQ